MVVMAHGISAGGVAVAVTAATATTAKESKTGIGSRRIFPPQFKLQVLDSYRNDNDCKGNQRATARKYGIHRRQIQKWLQAENNLRNSVVAAKTAPQPNNINNTNTTNASTNGYHKESERPTRPTRPTSATGCVKSESMESHHHDDSSDLALSLNTLGGCGYTYTNSGGRTRQRDDAALAADTAQNHCSYGARLPIAAALPTLSPSTASVSSSDTNSHTSSPIPIDFTTRTYSYHPYQHSPVDDIKSIGTSYPIDLSVKKYSEIVKSEPIEEITKKQSGDIWDLSTKKRTRSPSPEKKLTKPVKLFKPYLDNICDNKDKEKEEEKKLDIVNNNNNEYKYDYGYPVCYYENFLVYPSSHHIEDVVDLRLQQQYNAYIDFKFRAIDSYNDKVHNVHKKQVERWLYQSEGYRTCKAVAATTYPTYQMPIKSEICDLKEKC